MQLPAALLLPVCVSDVSDVCSCGYLGDIGQWVEYERVSLGSSDATLVMMMMMIF